MSMIGLFTGAPQATVGKGTSGDAKAAVGFGSTLQQALDALSRPVVLVETATGTPAPVSTPPLGELVETPTGDPLPASTGSAGGSSAPAPVSPLVELVETGLGNPVPALATPPVESVETRTGNPVPASTSSAGGSSAPAPVSPPVEPVETRTGNPIAASTGSAGGIPVPAPVFPLVELVETPTGDPVPASTGSAGGSPAPASTRPPVELVETRTATPAPTATTAVSVPPAPASDRRMPVLVTLASEQATTPVSATSPAAPPAAAPLTTSAQSVSPVTPPPAPAAAVPFSAQLARPIFSLAAAGAGEHVMTVSVTPENLGPVTVRAHVGADGVRVELFAPNDLGRDAIRTIIPELRRDLAGAGLGGNLALSSQNQPSAEGNAQNSHTGQPGASDTQRGHEAHRASGDGDAAPVIPEQEVDRAGTFGTTSTIDVLV